MYKILFLIEFQMVSRFSKKKNKHLHVKSSSGELEELDGPIRSHSIVTNATAMSGRPEGGPQNPYGNEYEDDDSDDEIMGDLVVNILFLFLLLYI